MAEYYQITDQSIGSFKILLSEEALREFKTNPDVLAVGAVDRKEACGVMLIQLQEWIWHITWLAVSDAYRRRGIATGFLNLAKQMAFENDVLLDAPFYVESEEDPIYQLFQSKSGYVLEENNGFVYRVPVETLQNLTGRLPKGKEAYEVVPFLSLPEEEKKVFIQKCREEGVLYFNPYDRDFLPPLCLAAVKNKKIGAVLLVREGSREDEILLNYVYSANPHALKDLFRKAADIAGTLPKKVKAIRVSVLNEEGENLVKNLLPEAERVGASCMATLDI